jgi:hypothetical protein
MASKNMSGLKIVFILHFIISGAVGLQHLLVPRVWTDMAGIEITETVTWRLIGAALLAFAVSSLLASREVVWERVRILVIMEIIWSFLAVLVIVWGILLEGLPPLEWVNVVLLTIFGGIFSAFYLKLKTNMTEEA